jgi:competence protein ComEC
MAIAQAAAMATLAAAALCEPAARAGGYVAHLAASGIVKSAGLVVVAPWLSRDVAPPAWWLVGGYYASCAVMLALPRGRRAGVCGLTVCGALMLMAPSAVVRTGVPVRPPGALRVVFMDVGQGDATVAVLPDGRALLVDAGGLAGSAVDIGERVVAPALRALGVRHLETLVITHGDPDHIGGAPAALHRFEPHTIWEGVPVPAHAGLRELAALASQASAAWRTVQAGDREVSGGVEIRVLHPPPPDWERQRVRNDDSIVLELRRGDVSIVLPGDIGMEGERQVVPRLDPGRVSIVKAAHHGSATSSSPAFIAAAHPAVVVFSEGRGNRFGHPAPAVVARYRAANALMFRTDEDGAIVMDTDGKSVEITTWSGRHVTLGR